MDNHAQSCTDQNRPQHDCPPVLSTGGYMGPGYFAKYTTDGAYSTCRVGMICARLLHRGRSMLLTIDPGVDTGWALFTDGRDLLACGLGDPRIHPQHKISTLRAVWIEHPMIYPRGQTPDPNAIVKLAINAGEWGGRYGQWCDVNYIKPYEWKGQVPKPISHKRTQAKLRPEELDIVAKATHSNGDGTHQPIVASKRHNMLDAIGIGLHVLGR